MLYFKPICIFLSFFILARVNSQNLVPNNSFEDTTFLPCTFIATEGEFNTYMNHWTLPTGGTSDIYSMLTPASCISNCFSTDPLTRGRQHPRTGNNMCGFYTYGFGSSYIYREYIQVPLTTPLITGKSYYAEMYVSAAEILKYVSNNIGMYFSAEQIYFPHTTNALHFLLR